MTEGRTAGQWTANEDAGENGNDCRSCERTRHSRANGASPEAESKS